MPQTPHPTILIINDGNRRWAQRRNLSTPDGYSAMVKRIANLCDELSARNFDRLYVTLCSLHNLSRPQDEVYSYYDQYLRIPNLTTESIKVMLHGNLSKIPQPFKQKYLNLVRRTEHNKKFCLHLMVNWSMNDEIVRIFNRLRIEHEKIDESRLLKNADIPETIDLIVRTGKRKRLSSCVPLGSPFAEIYFANVLFPDFDSKHLDRALNFFNEQIRTYGL